VNGYRKKEQFGAIDSKSRTPTKNLKTKADYFRRSFGVYQPGVGADRRRPSRDSRFYPLFLKGAILTLKLDV